MNLQEEYFKRHLLKCPVVKYVKEGYLILRSEKRDVKPKWAILGIQEQPQNNHPSDSLLLEYTPNYNGYNNHKGAYNTQHTPMNFDNYQPTIKAKIDAYRKNQYLPVFGLAEARVAAVEMFVYMWCSHFIESHKDTVLPTYYDVVNPATDIEDRVHAADKFEKTFLQMGDRTALNESWKQVKKYVSPDNYCSWIKTWF